MGESSVCTISSFMPSPPVYAAAPPGHDGLTSAPFDRQYAFVTSLVLGACETGRSG